MYSNPGNQDYGPSATAWISRYSVKHNAQSFTLTCAPDASASYPDTHRDYPLYWGVFSNVSYGLDVAYPQIKLSGGKGGLGSELLIGQRLTAGVPNVLDLVSPPSGATPGYRWSVEGDADPFKEFYVEVKRGNATSIGEKRQPSDLDLKRDSFAICFAKPGTATVKCATLHLAVPAGAVPAAGIDVDLDPVSATVVVPVFTEQVVVAKGTVVLDQPEIRGGTFYPGRLRLGGNNGTTFARPDGINYRSNITTPPGYRETTYSGTTTSTDSGGFRWVQVVTYGTTRTVADGSPKGTVQQKVCGPAAGSPGVYWNRGLDTFYPYAPVDTSDVNFNPPNTVDANDGWGLMYRANGGTRDANGNLTGPGESGDTPGNDLHRQDAASGGTTTGAPKASAYRIRDDFTVYQLYRPPGAGSQFVPVQSFHWYWGGRLKWSESPTAPGGGIWLSTIPEFGFHDFDSITPRASIVFPDFLWDRLMHGDFTTFRNQEP